MASTKKKGKTKEEHRGFNRDWTELFAFTCNSDGLPTCLICHEKLAHNKKSNLEGRFTTKHPAGEERKKAVGERQLFVRYMSSQGPKEELLGLQPLTGQTRGEDIANAVQKCFEDYNIDFNKIVSITTDGARSMTGKNKGATTLLQNKIDHEILVFHCIIHQEALCVQTFPAEIVEVTNLVIKIVNSILAKAFYHRQFKELLNEMESHYSDLLHNKVRWLSKGKVLNRFALLLKEIKTFLLEKGINHPQLEDGEWLQNFTLW